MGPNFQEWDPFSNGDPQLITVIYWAWFPAIEFVASAMDSLTLEKVFPELQFPISGIPNYRWQFGEWDPFN
jgi:hypothetical protein